MAKVKKDFELELLDMIKKGYNPSKISLRLNISLPNLSYYLSSLKRQGLIKKVGYGTWMVTQLGEVKKQVNTPNGKSKEVRGHAFIWKIRFKNKFNWKEILRKSNVEFEEKGIHKTPRIKIGEKKIWLGSKNVIIYETKSFYEEDSIQSKKKAIKELLETIDKIKQELKIELGEFKFTSRREHFSLIKNVLAKEYERSNKSLLVRNEEGYWFSIDNSFNLEEAETIGKDSMMDNLGVQKYFNSHKDTHFKVTPEFILESMGKITQNQLIFDRNIEKHQKVLEEMSETLKVIRDSLTKK